MPFLVGEVVAGRRVYLLGYPCGVGGPQQDVAGDSAGCQAVRGVGDADEAGPVPALRIVVVERLLVFHRRTVLSREVLASSWPSGEKARALVVVG